MRLPVLLGACAVALVVVVAWIAMRPASTPYVAPSDTPPAYTPPPVTDARLASFVDRQSTEPRVTPDQSARLPAVTEADFDAVAQVLLDTEDYDTVRHEAAELLRRSGYPHLLRDLLSVIENPAEEARFRSWAVQHVFNVYEGATEDEREAARPRFRAWLEDADTEVRREALLSLSRLGDPVAGEVAVTWLESGSEGMDLAIRILRENDARGEIERVRAHLFSEDVPTRMAALVTLSRWGDEESRAAMEAAATLPDTPENFRLRRGGRMALERLDAMNTENE